MAGFCIAIHHCIKVLYRDMRGSGCWAFVSQYTAVYCDQKRARGSVCCDPGHDTAMQGAQQAYDTVGQGHDTATVAMTRPLCERAWAHLGVLAGSAGCALGAPSQFLDSVLFLSHCWDTIHEHCSQIFLNFF